MAAVAGSVEARPQGPTGTNGGTAFVQPVFLFSLPRSGSTLTQRVLATHPAVETAAEPWILLPMLYTRIRDGVYAEYGHKKAHDAIEDFCSGLPGGSEEYLSEIRELALRLYARRSRPGARYFLDKTPRYNVISGEIVHLFPDARLVFLWRNPLAIVASIIETWGRGRWNVYEFEFELFEGLERLVAACSAAGERACSVRYEDLVSGDPAHWQRLFRHLDLDFDQSQLDQFSEIGLPGRMGDQTGRKMYTTLSAAPTGKWKEVLGSPVRKHWCRRYLSWIGEDRLRLMGYDLQSLLNELDSVPARARTIASDVARSLFGVSVRILEPWLMRDKLNRLRRRKRVYVHS